ncbi:MAG: hypothetical protein ACTSR0_07415 [Candidatus Asgardarchaeia archaeon]
MHSWKPLPLRSIIIEELLRHKGVMTDTELFNNIYRVYEISTSDFNKELMNLEIEGIIHVSPMTKNKRKVEVLRPEQRYLGVGED